MKRIFTYIATIILTSCSIMDYERELNTFDDYMRGVVIYYGFGTADALDDMLEANYHLFGPGNASGYTMHKADVWVTPHLDTLWTGGCPFMQENATWTISRRAYASATQHIHTFTRTPTGWKGSFNEIMHNEGYWAGHIDRFNCTMEILIEESGGNRIFHISGSRTEDQYSAIFGTDKEGMCNNSGCFRIETFMNGETAHSGTISFSEGDNWEYGDANRNIL